VIAAGDGVYPTRSASVNVVTRPPAGVPEESGAVSCGVTRTGSGNDKSHDLIDRVTVTPGGNYRLSLTDFTRPQESFSVTASCARASIRAPSWTSFRPASPTVR
jgi:hypothetical protein